MSLCFILLEVFKGTLDISKLYLSISGKEWRMKITFGKIYAENFCEKQFKLIVEIVKST